MNKTKLSKIIREHKNWVLGEGGQHADLRGADLQGADLRGAYLQGAYLRGADLRGADLRGADLQGADLRGADLQGANLRDADLRDADLRDTIYDNVNWLLLLGIVPGKDNKCRAYKIINQKGEGIYQGGINYLETGTFGVEKVDPDLYQQYSYGINLATLAWCLTVKENRYRLLLMEFDFADAVCPIGSDGKFRVKRCTKISECDWKGNLLTKKSYNRDAKGRFTK